jgi:NhaP-type Na+/H+ or K+/H+ antiporter
METGLVIASGVVVLYAAVALRLASWSISMPMVLVATGLVLGSDGMKLLPEAQNPEQIEGLTEITLALLLFADASTLNLKHVDHDAVLPVRLLTVGLPLTIAAGTGVALGLLPGENLAFAALIGAILAPTDAALGLAIFNNPLVPVRIRRALNVESGLNDGIATPFVTLFLAYVTATEQPGHAGWLGTALGQIGLAALAGAAVGLAGAWLLRQATGRGWTSGGSEQIAILGLGLTAYFGSLTIHGNGFIAAFVGGIVFGSASRNAFSVPIEFTETFSTFLSMLVWGLFGALLLPETFRFTTDWRPVAYAILSLTAVRMLPVAIALFGTRLRPDTVLLMGWFGPRGLASVVFMLIAFVTFEHVGQPIDSLVAVCGWTILLSVVLHGLSAEPLARWYGRRLAAAGAEPVELLDLPEMRPRHAVLTGKRS